MISIFKKVLTQLSWYANIVLFKTYANLKGENEKTYIGCLWWVVEPILNTIVFYLVFTYVLKIRTENFTIFLYTGMVIYNYFAGAIMNGSTAVIAHAGLMQQVYLPKVLFVLISISNLTWKFLFSLIVLFPLVWFHGMPVTWAYLAIPLLLFLQFIIVIGISLPLAALIPYFQDAKTVIGTILGIGMWFSGVFYTIEQVPQAAQFWFYLNPASVMIEAFRDVLMHGQWPNWAHFQGVVVVTAACWLLGLYLFSKVDRKITKLAI